MAKGPCFEREFAKRLSLWWTQGDPVPRDDVFWRTANSGGRATVRKKQNKDTVHQYGDITATDPVGIPFLQFTTVEIKRGYNKFTIADLMDKTHLSKEQKYEEWFRKAEVCRVDSGAKYWMLVVKRDRREALCFFPDRILSKLSSDKLDNSLIGTIPQLVVDVSRNFGVFGCHLSGFFERVPPTDIKALLK